MLQNAGIARTNVTHASLLVAAVPVLVALLAAGLRHGTAGPLAWAGHLLALAGVGFVAGGGGAGLLARPATRWCSPPWPSRPAFIVVQPRLLAGRDPIAVTAVQLGAGALAALPVALVTEGLPAAPAGEVPVLATVGLALAGTLLAFSLFAYGQSRVPADIAGAFVNLEPLVGALAAAVAFHEPFGAVQLAGAAAILAGLALGSLRPGGPAPAAAAPRHRRAAPGGAARPERPTAAAARRPRRPRAWCPPSCGATTKPCVPASVPVRCEPWSSVGVASRPPPASRSSTEVSSVVRPSSARAGDGERRAGEGRRRGGLAVQAAQRRADEEQEAGQRGERVAGQPEHERGAAAAEPQRLARLEAHAPEDLLDPAGLEGGLDVVVLADGHAARDRQHVAVEPGLDRRPRGRRVVGHDGVDGRRRRRRCSASSRSVSRLDSWTRPGSGGAPTGQQLAARGQHVHPRAAVDRDRADAGRGERGHARHVEPRAGRGEDRARLDVLAAVADVQPGPHGGAGRDAAVGRLGVLHAQDRVGAGRERGAGGDPDRRAPPRARSAPPRRRPPRRRGAAARR